MMAARGEDYLATLAETARHRCYWAIAPLIPRDSASTMNGLYQLDLIDLKIHNTIYR